MNFLARSVVRCAYGIAFFTVVLSVQATFAQGIHVTLRGNSNPSPGQWVYSDVVGDGNFAYVASWHNTAGVWIFDVSNPDAPKFLTHYAPSATTTCRPSKC